MLAEEEGFAHMSCPGSNIKSQAGYDPMSLYVYNEESDKHKTMLLYSTRHGNRPPLSRTCNLYTV